MFYYYIYIMQYLNLNKTRQFRKNKKKTQHFQYNYKQIKQTCIHDIVQYI